MKQSLNLITSVTLFLRLSSGLGDIMIDDINHHHHHHHHAATTSTTLTNANESRNTTISSLQSSSSSSSSIKSVIIWSSNQWNNTITTHVHPKGRQMISMLRRLSISQVLLDLIDNYFLNSTTYLNETNNNNISFIHIWCKTTLHLFSTDLSFVQFQQTTTFLRNNLEYYEQWMRNLYKIFNILKVALEKNCSTFGKFFL